MHPPHPSLPFPCAFLSLPPTYSCPNQPVYPPWRPSLVSPDRQTWCGPAGCGAEANHSHQCRGLIWRRRSTLPPMSGTEMPQTRFLLANVNDEIRNEIRTRHARDTQRDTRRVSSIASLQTTEGTDLESSLSIKKEILFYKERKPTQAVYFSAFVVTTQGKRGSVSRCVSRAYLVRISLRISLFTLVSRNHVCGISVPDIGGKAPRRRQISDLHYG